MGIAGMVLGIVSLSVCWWYPIPAVVMAVLGIVFSAVGIKIKQFKGISIAGLVISIVGCIAGGILIGMLAYFSPQKVDEFKNSTDNSNYDILCMDAEITVTSKYALKSLADGDILIEIYNYGVVLKQNNKKLNSSHPFYSEMESVEPSFSAMAARSYNSRLPYIITVTTDGQVLRTNPPLNNR